MKLTQKEINYSLRQLALRAGVSRFSSEIDPFQYFPVDIRYQAYKKLSKKPTKKIIYIRPAGPQDWIDLLNLNSDSISWAPLNTLLPPKININISKNIPILFPSSTNKRSEEPIKVINKNEIIFNLDIVAATFFMLSRYEEIINDTRDKYKRFPANESVAYKQGFLEQPIVDELGLILRSWIQYLLPDWRPEKGTSKVILTHDIDFIRTLPNMRKMLRTFFVNVKSENLAHSIRNIHNTLLQEKNDLARSPYLQNIDKIVQSSLNNGLKSIFFFKASNASFYDSGYDISHTVLKDTFEHIKDAGFEIGLHPGYYTHKNIKWLKREKDNLENQINTNVLHCRQHYMRFEPSVTWKCQQKAGFKFDHTLSYVLHPGFRCGTCRPFKPFDLEEKKEMDITEIPLIIMDSTLRVYKKYSPSLAKAKIIDLAKKCDAVEGTFTLLWHNTSFSGNWMEWGHMYTSVLPEISRIFYPQQK